MYGARSMHGEMRNAYEYLGGKLQGKNPCRRLRRRSDDNIKNKAWKNSVTS